MFAVAWSLCTSASVRADVGDDPLEWRPPAAKAQFRKLLSDTDYERQSAPIASRLTQAMQEAATRIPDHGLKISGVMAPGALEAQGVTLNDVIAAVDGEDLWGRFSPTEEAPIRARVYSAKQGRFRELRVATDLGLAFSVYRRPELAYLRSKDRNTPGTATRMLAWSPLRRTRSWQRPPGNAPWPRGHHATAFVWRPVPNWPLRQGHPEAALDFWYEAAHSKDPEPLDPLLAYRVMIANFKLEQARDLARKHPKLLPNVAEGLETLVALHRARPAAERVAAAPSVRARGMHRRDARKDLVGLSPAQKTRFSNC